MLLYRNDIQCEAPKNQCRRNRGGGGGQRGQLPLRAPGAMGSDPPPAPGPVNVSKSVVCLLIDSKFREPIYIPGALAPDRSDRAMA